MDIIERHPNESPLETIARWCETMHSVYVDANDHRSSYKTPAEHWADGPGLHGDPPPEGIEEWTTFFSVQVYVNTPIGFCRGNGRTLADAVQQCAEELGERR